MYYGQELGTLAIYRAYNHKSCLVDVGLLVSGFQITLVEALQRLKEAEKQSLEEMTENIAVGGLTAKGLTDAITPKI